MARGKVSREEFDAGLAGGEGLRALKDTGLRRDSPLGRDKVLPKAQPRANGTEPKSEGRTPRPSSAPRVPVPKPAVAPESSRASTAPRRRYKDPDLEPVPFSFRAGFRDEAVALARRIQRQRRGMPGDRVTASMLYRVFSEVCLEDFEWKDGDLVVTEAELKVLVRSRLGLEAGDG